MKEPGMSIQRFICGVCLILLIGCGSDGAPDKTAMQSYSKALAETDPMHRPSMVGGGAEAEQAAVDAFVEFYRAFSTATLESRFDDLYASNAYFYDGIKEIRGKERIKSYFRETLASMNDATILVDDVAVSDGNYYVRWRMDFALNRNPDDRIRALGMTHLRFDEQGRIIFHHDFWDTSVVFEKLPVIGAVIQWIKKKI
jgi:limonene-1,2-epoxide hydrolase